VEGLKIADAKAALVCIKDAGVAAFQAGGLAGVRAAIAEVLKAAAKGIAQLKGAIGTLAAKYRTVPGAGELESVFEAATGGPGGVPEEVLRFPGRRHRKRPSQRPARRGAQATSSRPMTRPRGARTSRTSPW
jgi:hypothetical protein